MNTIKQSAILALVLAGACAGGCASAPPAAAPAPQPRKDPQSALEPRSTPGEGQKYLSRMVGRWAVVKTFYPRGGGAPAVSSGRCTQKMIHEGRFLESDFVFTDAGAETTGTGVVGFDAETGLFTSFWMDSRSTRFSIRQSEAPFDGTRIVLFGKTIGDPGPNARRSRTESVLEDGDRRLVHRQYSESPDGPGRLVMQLEMTRSP